MHCAQSLTRSSSSTLILLHARHRCSQTLTKSNTINLPSKPTCGRLAAPLLQQQHSWASVHTSTVAPYAANPLWRGFRGKKSFPESVDTKNGPIRSAASNLVYPSPRTPPHHHWRCVEQVSQDSGLRKCCDNPAKILRNADQLFHAVLVTSQGVCTDDICSP